LAERRKTVGHTQEQLAYLLGVERSTVVRWEAGATDPLPWCRPKLARVLAISLDELHDLLTTGETIKAKQPGARSRLAGGQQVV
jgi:DNA-binding XRE family transcriptional regulator